MGSQRFVGSFESTCWTYCFQQMMRKHNFVNFRIHNFPQMCSISHHQNNCWMCVQLWYLASDIHKKKTFYAGDKTFIEGKAASFLYCSISHGLTMVTFTKKLPPFDIHLYFVGSSNLHQLQLISQYWLLYTQQGTTCHQNKYEIALVWKSESVQFWFVDENVKSKKTYKSIIYMFLDSWREHTTHIIILFGDWIWPD